MSTTDIVYTGMSVEALGESFLDNLFYTRGKFAEIATSFDRYVAVATSVRDRLLQRWIKTAETYRSHDVKVVCYFSAEYLMGPHLVNNLLNLGIVDEAAAAASQVGYNFEKLSNEEPEPGLGNGGLGRLAACYLDSLSSLEIPAIGYGIRYEYGIFEQEIQDGWQVEKTDKWLEYGNPWELARPESSVKVGFGGRTEAYTDKNGNYRVRWIPSRQIKAIPYDTPIPGYRTNTCNTLRLWRSEAVESFDFAAFNIGNYLGAVQEKVQSETISKILYPNDENFQGKELRLEQQFFFVSASLQDMIRIHLDQGRKLQDFGQKWAAQMNDTHPSIAVAELMRLLIDQYCLDWETAWDITRNTLSYTNHTLLPEALEKWPLKLFGGLLPRHLEIIYEINKRFLDEVKAKFPDDKDLLRRVSLIDEDGERYVRMAYLATVGGHAVNGVAELHTELLKKDLLRDFYKLYPERFSNKTNGVTPRRWIAVSNPGLAKLITSHIGADWLTNLYELKKLAPLAEDPDFQTKWKAAQHSLKEDLAKYIKTQTGIPVDPASLFDVMVKRIHEYKRQHLNVLHIVTLFNRIKKNPSVQIQPRTFIFGGKSAPGYFMAKLIIKLITSVGEVINNDDDVAGRLKVVFLPNYNVRLGQHVYPAADLSEQISTAGKEASGTGNMKFAMNGALTIGTLDGANIEIRQEVGDENFFLFGLTAPEVHDTLANGYNPRQRYESNAELKQVIDSINSGLFSRGDNKLFRPLVDSLLTRDPYLLLADYEAYIQCQDHVSEVFANTEEWTKKSILNSAHTGKFSSDRAVKEYCDEIWNVSKVPVSLS